MFETGTNEWRKYDAWPPKTSKPRTLLPGRRRHARRGARRAAADGFDEYVSDPAKPVPFIDNVAQTCPGEYMTADQRFAVAAARRAGVPDRRRSTRTSPSPGRSRSTLHVSTTGTDADWVVKLIDVYPDDYPRSPMQPPDAPGYPLRMGGYQQLVRGEPLRGKFRNSFEKPEPFEPGEPTKVEFTMPDVYHTFRRGHRLMVQVQSSWFPLVDRNPQTFCDIHKATEADFKKQTHRVYRSATLASTLTVRVEP